MDRQAYLVEPLERITQPTGVATAIHQITVGTVESLGTFERFEQRNHDMIITT